jgi:DnaJ like chaperone protein
MGWTGKLIGGGIGWALFGPLGALFGGMLGNQFDKRAASEVPPNYYESGTYSDPRFNQNPAGSFMAALMALCAYVIRADGEVKGAEVRAVREFVQRQFPSDANDLMQLLKELLEKDIPADAICVQIAWHLGYEERMELITLLIGIALADGELHPGEEQAITRIAALLRITPADLRALFGAAGAHRTQDGRWQPQDQGEDPYEVMGLDSTASNEELRKTWRELAKKFHPDRVQHLGEDVRRHSEEQFKRLQNAWSTIKRERNL